MLPLYSEITIVLIVLVFLKQPLLLKGTISKAVYLMWKMCEAKSRFWPT